MVKVTARPNLDGPLEPPDEPEGEPTPTEHVEGERINFIPRCALCGDSWPCEAVEDQ